MRERLLNAAETLFVRHGIATVGVDAVCGEANVAKMSLYKHFRSKDQLVAAYLQRKSSAFLGRMAAAMMRCDGGTRECILHVFDFLGEWFASPEFRGCPFLNAAAEIADAEHPARTVCLTHQREMQHLLRSQAKQLERADADRLAEQLMLLVDGAVMRAQITGSPETARLARDAAAKLLD